MEKNSWEGTTSLAIKTNKGNMSKNSSSLEELAWARALTRGEERELASQVHGGRSKENLGLGMPEMHARHTCCVV